MEIQTTPGGAAMRQPGYAKHCTPNSTDNTSAAQRARLYSRLLDGTLTTLQARRELDVLHPAARVMELRRDGHPIERSWTYDLTSEGNRHRVACYQLTGARRQLELPL